MAIEEANPGLKGKLGFFPIPGKTADKPGAVFTGGSDLVIPEASAAPGPGLRGGQGPGRRGVPARLAKEMSYVPNKVSFAGVLSGNEGTAAMAAGAANGHATPNSPNWAAVEAKNLIKEYMTEVLTGDDATADAGAASEAITAILNTKS